MACNKIEGASAAGSGEPALRKSESRCAQSQILRRAGCPHPAANSTLTTVARRRGAHRAPASPSRRSARSDMVCSKIEGAISGRCGHPPLRRSRSGVHEYENASPAGSGEPAPRRRDSRCANPKSCVGRGAVSAAVGGFAALRMRHTPCGCTPPRFCAVFRSTP